MGSHYILGRAYRDSGKAYQSAIHFLSALRQADMNTVPEDQRDALQRTYEAFLEVPESEQEPDQWNQTGERIESLLTSPDWESRLRLARAQLDAQSDSPGTSPLAEMLSLGKPQALIEAMGYLDMAVRRGMWRTAMEQAMLALDHGPTYLPLHLRITEIQLKEEKQTEALAKLALIARTYRIRGETLQASKTYERILQINPMDVNSRTELITLLVQQGDMRSALSFYLDLADVYTQLADLEGARQTYESALMLAVRNNADKSWQIQLLYRLGDLYMQRLDYRAALQTFQRLQQLDPTDEKAGTQLVDLMMRLGKNIRRAKSDRQRDPRMDAPRAAGPGAGLAGGTGAGAARGSAPAAETVRDLPAAGADRRGDRPAGCAGGRADRSRERPRGDPDRARHSRPAAAERRGVSGPCFKNWNPDRVA